MGHSRPVTVLIYLYGVVIFTVREERRLRVFESMVLRRIFGSTTDELTGEWRKPYNEELNDLYSSPYISGVMKSKRMRWTGHIPRMGGQKRCIQGFGGVTRGKETTWKTKA